MVDVIKRRITGVDDTNDDGQVEIEMANISAPSWSTGLPDTTAVTAPAALTLSVSPSGGLSPYNIRWYKNGNEIPEAFNKLIYTKTPTVAGADSGTYKVVAQDSFGNILVDQTVVTVS